MKICINQGNNKTPFQITKEYTELTSLKTKEVETGHNLCSYMRKSTQQNTDRLREKKPPSFL